MNWLYNNGVLPLMKGAFRFMSLFDAKVKRGIEGRVGLIDEVKSHYTSIDEKRKRVWIHVASFGELEQAKPVIEALRTQHADLHIHLTFFSPSGYENAKGKYTTPDIITYSPFDDASGIEQFLEEVRPDLALFAKYDVWPNAIAMLSKREVPSILFSATLGTDSGRFFPVVRNFNRRVYSQLTRILVIRQSDKDAFLSYGIDDKKISVTGDTRFDQVIARQGKERTAVLPESLTERWKQESRTIVVIGSAWTQDLRALCSSVTNHARITAWIIVPHEPNEKYLVEMESIVPGSVRHSLLGNYTTGNIILVDSIGKLFELYALADITYVGGGFTAGLHNTLEAAVWGKPVLVGPRHQKTKEVQELIDAGGAFEIARFKEADAVFTKLLNDPELQHKAGAKAEAFVAKHAGATARIVKEIERLNVLSGS
jgi:3-deoxy-D-manno-octulosonic-acid transferase